MNLLRTLLVTILISIPLKLAAEASPLRVGVIYGFTGAAQKWADAGRKGLLLARDELIRQGHRVELIFEDNGSDPKRSVSAFRKLVSVDKVDAIIASNWSILTNPLVPLSAQEKVVVVSPTVMDASVMGTSDHFFTLGNRIESLRQPIARYFSLHPDKKRVAFLCWDDAWGHANLGIWKEEANRAGATIVDSICVGDYSADFRPEVARMVAKKPDVVFVGMFAERVAARLRELSSSATIFTTNVVMEPLVDPSFKEDLFREMWFVYWQPNELFVEAYETAYNEAPILEAHNHYDALRSLGLAKTAAAGRPLLEGLKTLHLDGTSGQIDFRGTMFANQGAGSLLKVIGRTGVAMD